MRKYLNVLKIMIILSLLSPAVNACSANQPPVIERIIIGNDTIKISSSIKMTCIATDPENEDLTYTWSASGGKIEIQSRTIMWDAPEEPGKYDISVTVLDKGGNKATKQVSVEAEKNSPPVIKSLLADPAVTGYGKECVITCKATDPEGEALSYRWEASEGLIKGDGAEVTWIANTKQTNCTINVEVTDTHNNSKTKSINVVVTPNPAPSIKSLSASPQTVTGGETSTITCEANDADGDDLQYTWEATTGTYTGNGNAIIWTAPTDCQRATITVKVSDGQGGETSKSVTIAVEKKGG
jgi:hypothetical protein